MYLLIDNSRDAIIDFHFTDNQNSWQLMSFSNADLLVSLDKLLSKRRAAMADLQGIAVMVGVGRFTATRVAATIANTLALAGKIPVVAVDNTNTASLIEKIINQPVGRYISARYSAEANIGKI